MKSFISQSSSSSFLPANLLYAVKLRLLVRYGSSYIVLILFHHEISPIHIQYASVRLCQIDCMKTQITSRLSDGLSRCFESRPLWSLHITLVKC